MTRTDSSSTTVTRTLIAFAALLLAVLPAAGASFASAGKLPQKAASFEGSPAWAKLDLHAREAWRDAKDSSGAQAAFECLAKLSRPLTEEDRSLLAAAGFKLHTASGPILTGRVEPSRLPDVAALEVVQAIELATPLSLKKRNATPHPDPLP